MQGDKGMPRQPLESVGYDRYAPPVSNTDFLGTAFTTQGTSHSSCCSVAGISIIMGNGTDAISIGIAPLIAFCCCRAAISIRTSVGKVGEFGTRIQHRAEGWTSQ
jgi:hypothetical protein